MNRFSLLSFILLLASSLVFMACSNSEKTPGSKKGEEITLYFHYIPPYCGGIEPPQEAEMQRIKGEPLKQGKFIIKKAGESKILKQVTSGDDGFAKVVLPEGNYCIQAWEKSDEGWQSLQGGKWKFDANCISEWRANCDFEFKLPMDEDKSARFVVHGRCEYEGPNNCVTNPLAPPP